jgi:hypothetical protein
MMGWKRKVSRVTCMRSADKLKKYQGSKITIKNASRFSTISNSVRKQHGYVGEKYGTKMISGAGVFAKSSSCLFNRDSTRHRIKIVEGPGLEKKEQSRTRFLVFDSPMIRPSYPHRLFIDISCDRKPRLMQRNDRQLNPLSKGNHQLTDSNTDSNVQEDLPTANEDDVVNLAIAGSIVPTNVQLEGVSRSFSRRKLGT